MLRIRATLGCLIALTGFGCTSGAALPTAPDASRSPEVEAAACTSRMIVASSFDQSCVSDFDCVGVAEGNACEACGLVCPLAAISKRAMPAYQAAIANSPATEPGELCAVNCPSFGNPCCNSGRCTDQCPNIVLGLSDCADAGGACIAIDSLPDAAPTCSRLGDCPISVNQFGVCCPVVDAGAGD